MPQWGLTEELRKAEPWNIPAGWLAPSKVVTDPVHGDIYLSKLERAIVDSPPFERLRRIRQLGTVHFVYPGATHTRFSHALGALRVVQDLLDIILAQRDGREPDRDLFGQWEEEGSERRRPGSTAARFNEVNEFQWRVAETVVLARLGSLLHDVCHVAYGHTIEDDLQLLEPHDENPDRFRAFWMELGNGGDQGTYQEVQAILGNKRLKRALEIIILAKCDKKHTADERLRNMGKYPFVADLVTNTICADLLDYLPRDHMFTGLPVGLGQRFMTAFYVVPKPVGDESRHYHERMALRLSHHGRRRQDISSELLKHLRYRYELQERAIVHHAKLAADSMLGKMLELWRDTMWLELAKEEGGAEVAALTDDAADVESVADALVEDVGPAAAKDVDKKVSDRLEDRLREFGDDGLLEHLAGVGGIPVPSERVAQLAQDLLDRRLYKRAAQAADRTAKQRIFELFGSRSQRRDLERKAAAFVGIPEEHVVIWLPDPKMRLKIAEVLVDFGEGIAPFNEYSDRGREIYEDHRHLWTVTVFVHPSVRAGGLEPAILARLAELMGVEWDLHKPLKAQRPEDWPLALAAAEEFDDKEFVRELELLLEDASAQQVAHRASGLTFADLKNDIAPIASRIRKASEKRD
jgi:HD superfamily phosphohydrolase